MVAASIPHPPLLPPYQARRRGSGGLARTVVVASEARMRREKVAASLRRLPDSPLPSSGQGASKQLPKERTAHGSTAHARTAKMGSAQAKQKLRVSAQAMLPSKEWEVRFAPRKVPKRLRQKGERVERIILLPAQANPLDQARRPSSGDHQNEPV